MSDVWWGLAERAPGRYDWTPYSQLIEKIQRAGLKFQATISFHKCGVNTGDECYIPLPSWVTDVGKTNPDIYYTDQHGKKSLSRKCFWFLFRKQRRRISFSWSWFSTNFSRKISYRNLHCFCKEFPEPVQTLSWKHSRWVANQLGTCWWIEVDWTQLYETPVNFWFWKSKFTSVKDFHLQNPNTLSFDPTLYNSPPFYYSCSFYLFSESFRYPSYQLDKWAFPGVGEFQCYDKYMRAMLNISAHQVGHPEWGKGGMAHFSNLKPLVGFQDWFVHRKDGKLSISIFSKAVVLLFGFSCGLTFLGPNNAGTYNCNPCQDSNCAPFFGNGFDNFASPYGQFFLNWYSQALIAHGNNILKPLSNMVQGNSSNTLSFNKTEANCEYLSH